LRPVSGHCGNREGWTPARWIACKKTQFLGADMTIVKSLLLGATCCLYALAVTGAAAAPKIAGKYAALTEWHCQPDIAATFSSFRRADNQNAPAITSLLYKPNRAGIAQTELGYMTFVPGSAAATSGQVTQTRTVIAGSTQILIGSGLTFRRTVQGAYRYAYAVTETTLILTRPGQRLVYDMVYGNVVNGIAHTLYLMQVSGSNCMTSTRATRQ
jgi:hypothetical protein